MHRLFILAILACVQTVATADDSLPAYLIGLPDSVTTIYVAETSAAAFHRFENRAGQSIEYEGQTYMSIGEDGAGKQRAGDRRTPLGIYFVTEQLDTTRMHEKYGPMAFPLDYPSAWDQRAQRTGDGIWVHGVDARGGERPARDTDGCIALPNEALAKLEQTFRPNVTPVIIAQRVSWLNREQLEVLRSELEAALATWADSLRRGDVHAHVSLYDDDFRRWEMNKSEWTALMIETVGGRPIESVTISDVLLLGHPEEDGLYLSRFRQVITEAAGAAEVNKTKSTRRLYWRRSQSGGFKIIAEDAG